MSKPFTVKASGTLLGVLYTADRVFLATVEDGGGYKLHEFDRAAGDKGPLSTAPYASKAAVMKALRGRMRSAASVLAAYPAAYAGTWRGGYYIATPRGGGKAPHRLSSVCPSEAEAWAAAAEKIMQTARES